MDKYNVTGMSCAACSARVEKAVSKVPGVTQCSVSLLTNSMGVSGSADPAAVIDAVKEAGYGASLVAGASSGSSPANAAGSLSSAEDALSDKETPVLKRRLILSVCFLLVLMYFSMGHMMWGFPAPKVFDNHVFLALFEMILAAVIMLINSAFFTSGFKSLFKGGPNMNTLVALGSSVAFAYSLFELFMMIIALEKGDHTTVSSYGMNLYFESAAMIPTLITVGKLLEAISKGRTTDALKGLIKLSPKTATILVDGAERTISADDVKIDDIFLVRPGESIPVDGVILEGATAVNEAALTGESIPADKETGSSVYAATINTTGFIKCRATAVGAGTTLSKIIRTVSDAAATKAPIARIADRVSGIFVPAVMGISLLTFIVWLILGRGVSFSIARAITVLVISCPCALGLATPVAIMVGNGVGAKSGILFKTAASLEALGRTETVVLDKTGTITTGNPEVTDIYPGEGFDESSLLKLAASIERNSEHPLSKAIVSKASEVGTEFLDITDFNAVPGKGLTGKVSGKLSVVTGGSLKFISSEIEVSAETVRLTEKLSFEGKTPLLFALDSKLAGIIAVRDTVKEDSVAAIKELKDLGLNVVMLTGDNEKTAAAVGKEAGIERVIAGVLPDGKNTVIEDLKRSGKTAMVGDGINDAPALVTADTGIAIGAGADIAIDAADIVVVKSRLSDISAAIRLSRATIRNIHENLFWAFFYNIICIPLAMGVYGFAMKPMYGALAMSLSSFCVCMNALRLSLLRIHDSSHDRPARRLRNKLPENNGFRENTAEAADDTKTASPRKENNNMTKTMNIKGMMCEHCEARVKKTLLAIDGVTDAIVSHKKGTAEITLSKEVPDDTLKAAVEAQDYEVTGIE